MKVIIIIFIITVTYIVGMAKFDQYMNATKPPLISEKANGSSKSDSEITFKIKVRVVGEVMSQKSVEVPMGSTMGEVIDLCGGLRSNADYRTINREHILTNNIEIYIPSLNVGREKISINHASINELMKLPKIGETYANRIIEKRTALGEFTQLEQLLEVQGIGPTTFDSLKDLIIL